jgi:nucleoside-diphosphate-sugar epimerase
MNSNNILVTGANSGLGKYLCNRFNGVGFVRASSFSDIMYQASQNPFSTIIHAAFDPRHDVCSSNLQAYLQDTILLTKKLVQIPHHSFIFISTCDVYPKNEELHLENEDIKLNAVDSIYGISKLMSEAIVQAEACNPLVLRPTALLGLDARKNSLSKILTEKNATLTLSEQSTFNYVLHSDVAEFIEKALKSSLTGIYNIAASTHVSLGDVADFFKCTARFGNYIYRTSNINNDKASAVLTNFKKTSLENIMIYKKLVCLETENESR